LRVGGPGEGILRINSGGDVASGESRIGGPGGGHVNVGLGKWTTGNLAIGIDGGPGDLTIQDGGKVVSGTAVIGQEPGLGHTEGVQGMGAGGTSTWSVTELDVGAAGTGRLTVKDGAVVRTPRLFVARKAGVTGSVTVSGEDSRIVVFSEFFLVGETGVGELRIEDGGYVEANSDVSISFNGRGTVVVSGVNSTSGFASQLSALGDLLDGGTGPASM